MSFGYSCKKETPTAIDNIPVSDGVNVDFSSMPYEKLSDYNFFIGEIKDLAPNNRVLPYDLISSLFTDYAKKKRFIWMPEGVSADFIGPGEIFDFPDGTVTIKNFYYDNVLPDMTTRIIETRIIYKWNGQWMFAEYVWNEDQTEALFDLEGSFTPIEWLDENENQRSTDYRIPSESQCLTCHKVLDDPVLIGPKPQNINKIYDYDSGTMNQMEKWVEEGYLTVDFPADFPTVVDWKDENEDISDRMRSYVDINCAHCHSDQSHCSYRSMRFAYSESDIEENMGICVEPDENIAPAVTHIVATSNITRSMLYYRMNTELESERMPLLGRTLIHDEALELVEAYINSLEEPCP